MGKIIAFEWITVDGVFDASPELFEQWFLPYHSSARAEYIKHTIEGSQALLLGGKTYKMLAPFWSSQQNDDMGPANKLNTMPKYVVSSTTKEAVWNNTEKIIEDDVFNEIKKIKSNISGDILISGSATLVTSLAQEGLIDEFRLLIHPIIIASGKRFFNEEMPMAKLRLVKCEPLDLGVVAMQYQLH